MTVPSLFRGMFIATSLWNRDTTTDRKKESERVARVCLLMFKHIIYKGVLPCRRLYEDRVSQSQEEAEYGATTSLRQDVLFCLCNKIREKHCLKILHLLFISLPSWTSNCHIENWAKLNLFHNWLIVQYWQLLNWTESTFYWFKLNNGTVFSANMNFTQLLNWTEPKLI